MSHVAVHIIFLFLQNLIKGDYTCPQSQPCFYECTETVHCSSNPYTIQCPTSLPCTIHCTGTNVCSHTVINCPTNANCTVQCNGVSACSNAVINADTNIVGIDVICDDLNACHLTTVYWPSDDTVSRSLSCDSPCSGIIHYNSVTTKPTTTTSIPTKFPTIAPTTSYPTTTSPTVTTSLSTSTSYPDTTMITTLEPTTLQPTTLEPTTLHPTTLQPTTLQPTTLNPTTLNPTTLNPTTLNPTTLHPTTYPTVTGTFKSKVAISIGFEYRYNNTNNISHVKELLVNTTKTIINEGIIALNIDCYSSDYMIKVSISNMSTAKINATILVCNVTEGDKLAAYFQNMLGQNNVIESKYEENNDIIDLIADTSTIAAISTDIIESITSTTIIEETKTTPFSELNGEEENNDGSTVFIIIFSISSAVLCLCIIILIFVYVSLRNNNKNSNVEIEMPYQPQTLPSTSNISPSLQATSTIQCSDINTVNGEHDVIDDDDDDEDDDNDDHHDIYGVGGDQAVITPQMTPQNRTRISNDDNINYNDMYKKPEPGSPYASEPGSPSFGTHGFIGGASIDNAKITELTLDSTQCMGNV